MPKAAEEVRRRVISIFTHGGGGSVTGDGGKSSPIPEEGESGAVGVAGSMGLGSLVELQEKEISGLREELSKALKRVPRGGGESALEGALKKQVTHKGFRGRWARLYSLAKGFWIGVS